MIILVICVVLYAALIAGALWKRQDPAQKHLWSSSMGGQQFRGDARWCHACLEWVTDLESECPGFRSANCHDSKG